MKTSIKIEVGQDIRMNIKQLCAKGMGFHQGVLECIPNIYTHIHT